MIPDVLGMLDACGTGLGAKREREQESEVTDGSGAKLEAWLEFRRGENPSDPVLVCGDCGKRAQGNYECEGEDICDACGEAVFRASRGPR